eukprot:2085478-Alexandrium_andersonii.AAC.1
MPPSSQCVLAIIGTSWFGPLQDTSVASGHGVGKTACKHGVDTVACGTCLEVWCCVDCFVHGSAERAQSFA